MNQNTAIVPPPQTGGDPFTDYVETMSMLERLHRLLLDVIKDEFERLGILDINAVQALLLFNVGDSVLTAGELKTRGYYQGSNVSYNLKKLVEAGYMHHQRCDVDRRAVRVKLTERGQDIQALVNALFERHAIAIAERGMIGGNGLAGINADMKRLERFWAEQIRYIY
ncbi:DNA-binding MarR family transcriptional regulator [Rubricella aquisinus]|uniref:DNA-binding MarR family transcriptional regulator n=1 Tax=Rubricella aquisinus TaxID=2028108 RepID=A0A840WMR1_9RHOB|nr:winged helix DNA-binding protein [Rubricella aquisinus]MBB5514942.1 DNA-binding MarR family transcriptional regulator [Rubricella aquisinus]